MLVLTCNNISKSFGIDEILNDINFSVHSKDKIGIVGNNGSGKTTLLNILSDNLHPDTGEIFIKRDLKVGYLEQHTKISSKLNIFDECLKTFNHLIDMEKELRNLENKISEESQKDDSKDLDRYMEEYSVLSETFSESNGYGYESAIRGVLVGLGFVEEDFDKPIEVLSGGEKSRLALSKLLLQNPDILLLDEPTNHLDIDAINWLTGFINDYDGAVLLISHDRYFLDDIVNRIFHLSHTNLEAYNTNYTDFVKRRKENLEIYKKHYENQQEEIARHKKVIEQYQAYGGERYNRLAKSRQKMLDKIEVMDEHEKEHTIRFKFTPKVESGNDVLQVNDLEKSFGGTKLFKNISFNLYKGERVGIIGPNGVGKSTLFKIILNEITDYLGDVKIGHKVNIGYFDQEMEDLDFNKTIIDEVWDDNPSLNHYEIRTILSQFMFIGDDIFKEITDLSGGEKGRISILKLILSEANLLIMDEPTNHLDIDSKEILEDALLDYEGTVLVISHDRYFLNQTVDRILVMNPDGIDEYLGNYDYYISKINEAKTKVQEEESKTRTQIQNERKKERQNQAEKRKEKKRIKELEESIAENELLIEEYDELLCDTEIYSDPNKVFEITKKREGIKEKLDQLYEEWVLSQESY